MANIKYYNLVDFFSRGKGTAAACAAASTKALTNEATKGIARPRVATLRLRLGTCRTPPFGSAQGPASCHPSPVLHKKSPPCGELFCMHKSACLKTERYTRIYAAVAANAKVFGMDAKNQELQAQTCAVTQ